MSDLKLPPSTASQRILTPAAQPVPAQPAAQAQQNASPAATPAIADKVVSQAIQSGQASASVSFVDTPAAPSKSDLDWARSLEAAVKNGYQPSETESKIYAKIADQLEASQATPPAKAADSVVSARECAWALDLEARVKQGTSPSPKELASYRNIALRLLKAEQVAPTPAGVSEGEMAWARQLQRRITEQDYQPSPKELEVYSDIYTRSQAKPQAAAKVPMADLAWANQLQQRMSQGYKPSATEQQRYIEIYTATQAQNAPDVKSVSADESKWALALSEKVNNQGYKPTQDELDRYGDISDRFMIQNPDSIDPRDGVVSQHELDWAGKLQQRARDGVAPSDEEQQRYQAIHQRHVAG